MNANDDQRTKKVKQLTFFFERYCLSILKPQASPEQRLHSSEPQHVSLSHGHPAIPDYGSLAEFWVELIDDQSGRPYYLNTQTSESSWIRPTLLSETSPEFGSVPISAPGPMQLAPDVQQRPHFQQLFSGILEANLRGEVHALSRINDQFITAICHRILEEFEEGLVAEMVSGTGGAERRLATAANRYARRRQLSFLVIFQAMNTTQRHLQND